MPIAKVTISFDFEYTALDWRDDLSHHLDRLDRAIVWEIRGENVDMTVAAQTEGNGVAEVVE